MSRQSYTSSPQIIPPDGGLGHLARSGLLIKLVDIPSREIRESLSRAPLPQIVEVALSPRGMYPRNLPRDAAVRTAPGNSAGPESSGTSDLPERSPPNI